MWLSSRGDTFADDTRAAAAESSELVTPAASRIPHILSNTSFGSAAAGPMGATLESSAQAGVYQALGGRRHLSLAGLMRRVGCGLPSSAGLGYRDQEPSAEGQTRSTAGDIKGKLSAVIKAIGVGRRDAGGHVCDRRASSETSDIVV